jgi:hypothetical protein
LFLINSSVAILIDRFCAAWLLQHFRLLQHFGYDACTALSNLSFKLDPLSCYDKQAAGSQRLPIACGSTLVCGIINLDFTLLLQLRLILLWPCFMLLLLLQCSTAVLVLLPPCDSIVVSGYPSACS